MPTTFTIAQNTKLTETVLPNGNVFIAIVTEVEKDWAGKKNSITTQRTILGSAPYVKEIDSALKAHNYTMDNLGINSYDHAH